MANKLEKLIPGNKMIIQTCLTKSQAAKWKIHFLKRVIQKK